jgi:hypothetical protein
MTSIQKKKLLAEIAKTFGHEETRAVDLRSIAHQVRVECKRLFKASNTRRTADALLDYLVE